MEMLQQKTQQVLSWVVVQRYSRKNPKINQKNFRFAAGKKKKKDIAENIQRLKYSRKNPISEKTGKNWKNIRIPINWTSTR